MSYDLVVFDPNNAPKNLNDFMAWSRKQEIAIGSDLNNDNPDITTPELKKWFMECIKDFIPLSGPFSNEDEEDFEEGQDDEHGADYFIGRNAIYVLFSMEETEKPTKKMLSLAKKYGVGFCDFNSVDDYIYYPDKKE